MPVSTCWRSGVLRTHRLRNGPRAVAERVSKSLACGAVVTNVVGKKAFYLSSMSARWAHAIRYLSCAPLMRRWRVEHSLEDATGAGREQRGLASCVGRVVKAMLISCIAVGNVMPIFHVPFVMRCLQLAIFLLVILAMHWRCGALQTVQGTS